MRNELKASRRCWLRQAGTLFIGCQLTPIAAAAVSDRVSEIVGGGAIEPSRVSLTIPALAENGNSVALTVAVESPMSDTDYVREVLIIAEKNPIPEVVRFHFTPDSGIARAQTRVRLADTQTITAVAVMNDGRRYGGSAEVVVTEAACLEFLI